LITGGKLRIRENQVAGDAVDISAWLRGLDPAQYEAIFRENAIDAEILPELTEADLEKLGGARQPQANAAGDRRVPVFMSRRLRAVKRFSPPITALQRLAWSSMCACPA
jgi:SAM domain (Sterile alpha motif)